MRELEKLREVERLARTFLKAVEVNVADDEFFYVKEEARDLDLALIALDMARLRETERAEAPATTTAKGEAA